MFKNALDDSAAVRVSGEGEDLRDTDNCTFLLIQHRVNMTEAVLVSKSQVVLRGFACL